MDIKEIISQLKEKFGSSFDVSKVTEALGGFDLKSMSMNDIIAKLTASGLLDADALKGGVIDNLKSKAGGMLGGLGGMFGK